MQAIIKQTYEEINEERVSEPDRGQVLSFGIGDQVIVYNPAHKKGESTAFRQRWKGPYTVLTQLTPSTYTIDMDGLTRTVNADRMRKYKQAE
jgi:hypothetical protein